MNITRRPILAVIVFACVCCSCSLTHKFEDSRLAKNWGDSHEAQRFYQIQNPVASARTDPITGLAGEVSMNNREKHFESFKKPAPDQVFNTSIGGLGQ
jgi:hypothetical protein